MTAQKIVVTGSEGAIGKVVVDELIKQGHEVISIDKNASTSIDIMKDTMGYLFEDVETVIHLAANPSPEIDSKVAHDNIVLVQKVLEASKNSTKLKRIVNASSVHVYPYFEMYHNKETLTRETPLSPNLYWPPAEYARAKIKAEQIVDTFCKENHVASIQLRFGHVSEDDVMSKFETDWENDLESKTFLTHSDLRKMIDASITLEGMQSYLCISNPSWLVADNILFPGFHLR